MSYPNRRRKGEAQAAIDFYSPPPEPPPDDLGFTLAYMWMVGATLHLRDGRACLRCPRGLTQDLLARLRPHKEAITQRLLRDAAELGLES